MKLINSDGNSILADEIRPAKTFFSRLKGLMFRKKLKEGEALLLEPCNMVHTFFMRFPLDIVFLDRGMKVVYIIENMEPWKCSPMVKGCRSIIELPSGAVCKSGVRPGDILELRV